MESESSRSDGSTSTIGELLNYAEPCLSACDSDLEPMGDIVHEAFGQGAEVCYSAQLKGFNFTLEQDEEKERRMANPFAGILDLNNCPFNPQRSLTCAKPTSTLTAFDSNLERRSIIVHESFTQELEAPQPKEFNTVLEQQNDEEEIRLADPLAILLDLKAFNFNPTGFSTAIPTSTARNSNLKPASSVAHDSFGRECVTLKDREFNNILKQNIEEETSLVDPFAGLLDLYIGSFDLPTDSSTMDDSPAIMRIASGIMEAELGWDNQDEATEPLRNKYDVIHVIQAEEKQEQTRYGEEDRSDLSRSSRQSPPRKPGTARLMNHRLKPSKAELIGDIQLDMFDGSQRDFAASKNIEAELSCENQNENTAPSSNKNVMHVIPNREKKEQTSNHGEDQPDSLVSRSSSRLSRRSPSRKQGMVWLISRRSKPSEAELIRDSQLDMFNGREQASAASVILEAELSCDNEPSCENQDESTESLSSTSDFMHASQNEAKKEQTSNYEEDQPDSLLSRSSSRLSRQSTSRKQSIVWLVSRLLLKPIKAELIGDILLDMCNGIGQDLAASEIMETKLGCDSQDENSGPSSNINDVMQHVVQNEEKKEQASNPGEVQPDPPVSRSSSRFSRPSSSRKQSTVGLVNRRLKPELIGDTQLDMFNESERDFATSRVMEAELSCETQDGNIELLSCNNDVSPVIQNEEKVEQTSNHKENQPDYPGSRSSSRLSQQSPSRKKPGMVWLVKRLLKPSKAELIGDIVLLDMCNGSKQDFAASGVMVAELSCENQDENTEPLSNNNDVMHVIQNEENKETSNLEEDQPDSRLLRSSSRSSRQPPARKQGMVWLMSRRSKPSEAELFSDIVQLDMCNESELDFAANEDIEAVLSCENQDEKAEPPRNKNDMHVTQNEGEEEQTSNRAGDRPDSPVSLSLSSSRLSRQSPSRKQSIVWLVSRLFLKPIKAEFIGDILLDVCNGSGQDLAASEIIEAERGFDNQDENTEPSSDINVVMQHVVQNEEKKELTSNHGEDKPDSSVSRSSSRLLSRPSPSRKQGMVGLVNRPFKPSKASLIGDIHRSKRDFPASEIMEVERSCDNQDSKAEPLSRKNDGVHVTQNEEKKELTSNHEDDQPDSPVSRSSSRLSRSTPSRGQSMVRLEKRPLKPSKMELIGDIHRSERDFAACCEMKEAEPSCENQDESTESLSNTSDFMNETQNEEKKEQTSIHDRPDSPVSQSSSRLSRQSPPRKQGMVWLVNRLLKPRKAELIVDILLDMFNGSEQEFAAHSQVLAQTNVCENVVWVLQQQGRRNNALSCKCLTLIQQWSTSSHLLRGQLLDANAREAVLKCLQQRRTTNENYIEFQNLGRKTLQALCTPENEGGMLSPDEGFEIEHGRRNDRVKEVRLL